MSRCNTCKFLAKNLQGWQTQFCPKCQRIAQTVEFKQEEVKEVKEVKMTKQDAFAALMSKAAVKKEQNPQPCPCNHS